MGAGYLRELETAEVGDGPAMQVYAPNTRNTRVGFGFGLGRRLDPSAAGILELKAAVQLAHLRPCELTKHQTALARDLSPREEDVLRWIARGRSNPVIGDVLGLSRHTVDILVRRLFEKLDVSDRTTAVLKGLGVGIVDLRGVARSRDVT